MKRRRLATVLGGAAVALSRTATAQTSAVRDGGLMSYGPDLTESFERAAALIDRIFKGAKPSELPFEHPTRYPFVINLKTAKAMGLEIPQNLLARADEVIE